MNLRYLIQEGNKNLEDTAAAALQKIEDKKYASVLERKGFAFEGKNVWISGEVCA